MFAGMAELVDALDLGSSERSWGFESLYPHQRRITRTLKTTQSSCYFLVRIGLGFTYIHSFLTNIMNNDLYLKFYYNVFKFNYDDIKYVESKNQFHISKGSIMIFHTP